MDSVSDHEPSEGYLTGQLLIAMPTMRDKRFERTVIYMCAHNSDGAMGLVVNRLVGSVTLHDLLSQLGGDAPEVEWNGDLALRRLLVRAHGAGLAVDPDLDLARGAVLLAGRGQERGLDALEECLGINVLLPVNRIHDP